jgi:hypothetical protein
MRRIVRGGEMEDEKKCKRRRNERGVEVEEEVGKYSK